ncbi:hypothetical protein OHT76_01055 [Streptomyces sp. NBC_00287]|uniref:hypothetical protein n=1 Tax=Streptomyces sp. NBC_00287 TaxID=2975702 RepID=UPI002E2AFD5A|nr:hypothetical protein [Streptomyces sp. NBC_00287]
MDDDARWAAARRLRHDDTLKPEDRLAGLLLLLYASGPLRSPGSPSTTSRRQMEGVLLGLEGLAALALDLVALKRVAQGSELGISWVWPGC